MRELISKLYPEIELDKYSSLATCRGHFRPLMLVVETVNICNNDCVFCAYSAQTRTRKTMDMGLYKKIIRDYVDMGGGPVSFTPVVGDAFLDKHMVERIRFARQFPQITSLSVTTNAVMTYLRDEGGLSYILRNLNQVYVSIYGLDEEEYAALTKKRTYNKMIDGIRRILDLSDGVILLGFRLLKERRDDEIRDWIADVRRGTRYQGEINYQSTRTYANWSVLDTSRPLPFGARWMPTPDNDRQCVVPFFACQVLVNGRVSFCSCPNFDDDDQLSLGNAGDESLLNILNNERSRRLWDWQSNGVPDFCRTCSFHSRVHTLNSGLYTDPVYQIGG